MKLKNKLMLSLFMGMGLVSAHAQVDKKLWFYLCIGQSNMVGQAPILKSDTTEVSDRFFNLCSTNDKDRHKGEFRKAVPPLCRYWTKMGPADFFGRTMVKYLPADIKVGLVHVGVDGCASDLFHKDLQKAYVDSIKPDWMRNEVNAYDGNPRARLIEMARLAQTKGVIKGIIYHQGETDAYGDKWLRQMREIYDGILADLELNAADVPLIVGETAGKDQNGVCAHANPTIDRIHEAIPTGWVVSSYGCKVSEDNVHFAHEGYEELGKRYALKMLALEGFNVPSVDAPLQTEIADDAADAFKVECNVIGGKVSVISDVEMVKVSLVSFSGETIDRYKVSGKKTLSFKTAKYGEDRLILVIESTDGKKVTKKVTL